MKLGTGGGSKWARTDASSGARNSAVKLERAKRKEERGQVRTRGGCAETGASMPNESLGQ